MMNVRQRTRFRRFKSILRSTGLLAALVIAVVVQLAEVGGLLRGWNDSAYNVAVRLKAYADPAPPQVLLVYADRNRYRDLPGMLTLLNKLQQLGAPALGLTVPYEPIPSELLDWSRQNSCLVLAAPQDGRRSLPAPEWTWGRVELIHGQTAVYSRHYGLPAAGERRLPSLEAILAERMGVAPGRIPQGVYGVDFRGSVNSLPQVDAEVVCQDELTPEFVQGRAVLIGLPADPLLPGVMTPTTTGGQRMSPLEFHGQALNTILTHRAISSLRQVWCFPLYVSCALMSVLAFRRPSLRYGLAVVLLLAGAMVLMSWFVLWWTHCWLPLASLTLVQMLAASSVFDQRLRYLQEACGRLHFLFSSGPRQRSYPLLPAAPAPWEEMMALMHQLFPLQRAAVLIVPEGQPNLQQVALLGGEADVVRERRRDIHRSPFLEAIESRGLWRIDGYRPFFQVALDQQQFLLPLLHAGHVKGMLAWALSKQAVRSLPDLAAQARDVAEELAEVIARWQAVRHEDRLQTAWPGRWWTFPEERAIATLEHGLHLAERRLSQTSRLIEESVVGKAVYDICGRMVTMNATMFRLLHPLGLASMDTSLLQLAKTLLQCTEDEARALLRNLILEKEPDSFLLTQTSTQTPWMLQLRPLCAATETTSHVALFDPFFVQGVNVELMDSGVFQQLGDARQHPAEQTLDAVGALLSEAHALAAGSS